MSKRKLKKLVKKKGLPMPLMTSPKFKFKEADKFPYVKKLTGGQAKLDKNKNNRIDAEDFKMLRAGKKKGGMFRGYTKAFETAAGPGSKGTSTIVGVKPNVKKQVAKSKRKTYKTMDEMRKAKGFKPGETAAQFNKRRMALASAKEAVKATRIGKIVAPIALAGVAATQYLKSKMKKKEKKEKKMGGGMMKKPMGYVAGGALGLSPKQRSEPRDPGPLARRRPKRRAATATQSPSPKQARPKESLLEAKAYKAGRDNVFSNFRTGLKKAEKQYASIPSGMKKNPETDTDIKLKLLKASKKPALKEFKDTRREVFATERMGGGMMNKPMGYKTGKSVKAKCKLGRNKPTKMY